MVWKKQVKNVGARHSFLSEALEPRTMLSLSGTILSGPETALGNSWTYVYEDDPEVDTVSVVSAATENGQPAVERDTSEYDKGLSGTADGITKDFLGATSAGALVDYNQTNTNYASDGSVSTTSSHLFEPAEVIIPATLEVGQPVTVTTVDTFTVTDFTNNDNISTVTRNISNTGTLVSDTPSPITVPAGTFDCYQVDQTLIWTQDTGTTTIDETVYLAQGVGIVEIDEQDTETGTSGSSGSGSSIKELSAFTGGDRLVFTPQQLPNVQAGDPIQPSFTVSVDDSTGALVTDATGTVTLTPVGVNGDKPISGNSATLVDGVATFSKVTLSQPGSYQLQASDSNGDSVATSNKFGVGGDKLKFLKQPTSGDINDPLAMTVEVLTPKGKVDADFSGSVVLSLNTISGGTDAELSGTTTLALTNGLAVFTTSAGPMINVGGSYTLTATEEDTSTGVLAPANTTTPATSNQFAIAGYHLFIKTEPASEVGALSPIAFVVEEVDKHNKVNTLQNSATTTLTLQSSSNTNATLGGVTTVTFNAGIASFVAPAGPTIDTPGTFSLVVDETNTDTPASAATTRDIKVLGYKLRVENVLGYDFDHVLAGKFTAVDDAILQSYNQFPLDLIDPKGSSDVVLPAGLTVSITAQAVDGDGTLVSSTGRISDPYNYYAYADVSAPGTYKLTFTATSSDDTAFPASAITPVTDTFRYLAPKAVNVGQDAVTAGQKITYGGGISFPTGGLIAPSQSAGYLISLSGGSANANLPKDVVYPASSDGTDTPNLVIDTPGSYKITASVLATPGGLPFDPTNYVVETDIKPNVQTIKVLPPKLVFIVAPNRRMSVGQTFSVTLALTDSDGNVLTDFDNSADYQGAVLAIGLTGSASTGSSGFVNPTSGPIVITNGEATFSNLSFSAAGIYALHAKIYYDYLSDSRSPYQVPDTSDAIANLVDVVS